MDERRIALHRLGLVHISGICKDLSRLQRCGNRSLVGKHAAGRVDDHNAVAHACDVLCVDDVQCIGQRRQVDGDDVGLLEHLVKRDDLRADLLGKGVVGA